MIQRFLLVAIMLTGIIVKPAAISAQKNDSIAVIKAVEKFVEAFNHFQWEPFRQSFTADASIFFPEWDYAARISGIENIEKTWLQLFPEFMNNPDKYEMEISPKNISIQLYGHTALMTFHLGDGVSRLSRRTMLWVKRKGTWKIAHLHASFMKKETINK